jgi:hypothetical protein
MMPPAAKNLFEKRFLDFQKFFIRVFRGLCFLRVLRGLWKVTVDLGGCEDFSRFLFSP